MNISPYDEPTLYDELFISFWYENQDLEENEIRRMVEEEIKLIEECDTAALAYEMQYEQDNYIYYD